MFGKNYIYIIVMLLLFFFVVSCGLADKSVQYSESFSDVNQPVACSNGWGQNYSYPIIVDISSAITSENSNLSTYIQNAINTWNSAIGRTILSLRTGTVTKTGNDFNGLFSPLKDSHHALYFDQLSGNSGGWISNTAKSSSVIATTVYLVAQGTIFNASIRFNRDTYYFDDITTHYNAAQQIADMESIVLHELGHFIGLGHVLTETNSVMSPYYSPGHTVGSSYDSVRCVSANDITRIRSIYTGGSASTACLNP
ncbi:matrixin family metalloprotease [Pigmentibacter ruber]